ncbi:MAG: oligosaccharide flippase family protein, partial [bacterium]|nr:oligosaccharide flippase family protein [bacterium]
MQSLREKGVRALRSSERLFKLDMVYLFKGGLWTTLSFVVGTLASLVTMVAFGNLLPREAYGTYNYLLSLGATLSFLTLSGISVAVMRAVARGHENIVPAAMRLQLKYNLIAIAMVMASATYYGYKGNTLFALSLAMLAIAYPLAQSFHIFKQILTGKKRFDTLTKITSIITLISTLATVATLFLTDNVLIIIAVYSLMSLLPNLFAYKSVSRHLDKSLPAAEQITEMRRTAFHFTGAGLIGTAAQYIDKIVLFQVAGPASLAVYGFALAGPESLKSLVKNWTSIALPRLAQSSLPEIRRVLYRRITYSMLIGGALSLVYWLLAPILFNLFLPRYTDAIIYSQILALGLIIMPAVVYIGSIFSSQNMLRANYALNIGNHILRISLYLILGWLWQIWGLIIASLLSSLINTVYGMVIWEFESRRLLR